MGEIATEFKTTLWRLAMKTSLRYAMWGAVLVCVCSTSVFSQQNVSPALYIIPVIGHCFYPAFLKSFLPNLPYSLYGCTVCVTEAELPAMFESPR
jgi:hypothetical protein